MKREILVLLCVIFLGTAAAGCITAAATGQSRTVAWWTLIFEKPNPEQLPVRVNFRWAKGLE